MSSDISENMGMQETDIRSKLNIICVYEEGGKGHYIPAKAVAEQLEAFGHNVTLIEFFNLINIRIANPINVKVWRRMLKNTERENKFSMRNDQNTNLIKSVSSMLNIVRRLRFRKIIKEYSPDMIFTTHPYAGYFLAELANATKTSVPVSYYATDAFSVPMSAINNNLYALYVPTEEGKESAIRRGQDVSKVRLCPFPLQANCKSSPRYTKQEARAKLGLKKDVFTLQLNFGGEGLGSYALLEKLGEISSPMQVILIGGMKGKTIRELEEITAKLPNNIDVHIPGFVTNVSEYVLASDIIAGRSGINTLVECFYLHRPFLITELVYTVIPSADYVEKHRVGWNRSNDVEGQLDILKKYVKSPALLDEMDKNFNMLPISYDAAGLAEMVVEDAITFKERCKQN